MFSERYRREMCTRRHDDYIRCDTETGPARRERISALETASYEIPNPGLYSLLSGAAAKESMSTDLRFAGC